MRKTLLLSLALLAALTSPAQDAAVVARNAWVRLPLPSKTETALYVTLENHGDQRRSVVGGVSEAAAKIELHEMKMIRSAMYMAPVTEVKIPAKGKVSFTPESYHVMLYGLKSKLMVGDSITVTLKLDDGGTVPVRATVRK
jgi:periplasmic copper chaperone A